MSALDDRAARAVGIPAFALTIPPLTGLYGDGSSSWTVWWLGFAYFTGLSFAIWHGNRWLLLRSRSSTDWLERPVRRIVLLLAGIVLYTAPLTLSALWAWSRVTGIDLSPSQMREVTLANVICVIFVAHVYETVLLVKDRAADLVERERAERARVEAELLALQRQVDPHFLFNCLNTLQHLVESDPPRAVRFNQDLAAMMRYLLSSADRGVVSLEEEMAFVQRYVGLLRIRFGNGIALAVAGEVRGAVPPTAVQCLIENVVKHNALSSEEPLLIEVEIADGALSVSNRRRPKAGGVSRVGVGLANLAERVRLSCGRALRIDAGPERFTVTLPLQPESGP
jgi:sensor histidine kinase YesM